MIGFVGHLDRVPEGLVGHVGDIHHHAQAVHLANHVPPKQAQAVVAHRIGGGVGPVVRVEVRQRDVAHAQLPVEPEHREAVVDGVAALDAGHRGVLALRHDAAAVGGGERDFHVVGVGRAESVEAVQKLQAAVQRALFGNLLGGNVAGPPLHAQVALLYARQVQMALAGRRRQVLAVVGHAADRVGVSVHHERRKMEVARPLANGVLRCHIALSFLSASRGPRLLSSLGPVRLPPA